MWLGAIRLNITTKDATDAETDSLVVARILRDGSNVANLRLLLDYETEDDLERGAVRNYDFTDLPWRNDRTERADPGVVMNPPPYPEYGIEFSDGLKGHLTIQLEIRGDDMWIKDNVAAYVKTLRQDIPGMKPWNEDPNWVYIGRWTKDTAMSTDSDEGVTKLNLRLP